MAEGDSQLLSQSEFIEVPSDNEELDQSTMSQFMKAEIKDMIMKTVASIHRAQEEPIKLIKCVKFEKDALTQTTQKQPRGVCDTIHHGVQCNGCKTLPILGIRYRSLASPDYNLCSNCEQVTHQEFFMVRMRFEDKDMSRIGRPETCKIEKIDDLTDCDKLLSMGRRGIAIA